MTAKVMIELCKVLQVAEHEEDTAEPKVPAVATLIESVQAMMGKKLNIQSCSRAR